VNKRKKVRLNHSISQGLDMPYTEMKTLSPY